MDFFFDNDNLPSTSKSPPEPRCENAVQVAEQDEGLGTDLESSKEQSSCTSIEDIHCTSSRIDDISRKVQDLVGKIYDSRTNDQKIMDSFQEKLMEKVTQVCQQMKEHMYTVYDDNSKDMQAKLQELSVVLENCSKHNDDLQGANQALAGLRKGLVLPQTPE